MATKSKRAVKPQKFEEIITEAPVASDTITPVKKKNQYGKLMTFGWLLLLFGGLGHMLPEQMAPVLKWSAASVSVQMAAGVLSVIVALYYLLEE